MHVLNDKELYEAMMYAHNINESDAQEILNDFHVEQPALAETIFNIFPSIITEKNRDMANFYLELCFDAVCVYQHAFGTAVPQTEDWLVNQMSALETDFLTLKQDKNNVPKKNVAQTKFSDVLKESIDDYASENSVRVPFIAITQSMMLAMLNLLESLYKNEAKIVH